MVVFHSEYVRGYEANEIHYHGAKSGHTNRHNMLWASLTGIMMLPFFGVYYAYMRQVYGGGEGGRTKCDLYSSRLLFVSQQLHRIIAHINMNQLLFIAPFDFLRPLRARKVSHTKRGITYAGSG